VASGMQHPPIQPTMVIALKSDEMRGQYQVKVRCTSQNGVITVQAESRDPDPRARSSDVVWHVLSPLSNRKTNVL